MNRIRRNPEAYERLHRVLEWPMLVLSALFAVALLLPIVASLPDEYAAALESIVWFIWAAFVFEYVALLYVAPDRREMVRTHVLDLLVIALPFLRPLRLLRLIPLLLRALTAVRRIFNRPGFQGFLVVAGSIVVIGSALVYVVERAQPEPIFEHFGDALWWAIVTSTTVGYGDYAPETAAGRGVAVVLMLVGIGLFSVVTANIAAYFVESDSETKHDPDVAARLDRIEQLLEARMAEERVGRVAVREPHSERDAPVT